VGLGQTAQGELEAEGVEVGTGRTGEMSTDFVRWGWFSQVGGVALPDGVQVAEDGGDEHGESKGTAYRSCISKKEFFAANMCKFFWIRCSILGPTTCNGREK